MGWGARFAGVLVAGAVLAGAAACGGAGPEGQALPAATSIATAESVETPTPTADPIVSATPSATSVALSEMATERTVVGVQAFARHYLEVVNRAFATGNVGDLKSFSAGGCKTCTNWLDNIERVYGAGGSIEGGQLEVLGSDAADPEGAEVVSVDVDSRVSKQIDRDSDGKVLQEYPKESGRLVLSLRWSDDGWQVREIKFGGLQ